MKNDQREVRDVEAEVGAAESLSDGSCWYHVLCKLEVCMKKCKRYLILLIGLVLLSLSVCLMPACGHPGQTFEKYGFSFEYYCGIGEPTETGNDSTGTFEWVRDSETNFGLMWLSETTIPKFSSFPGGPKGPKPLKDQMASLAVCGWSKDLGGGSKVMFGSDADGWTRMGETSVTAAEGRLFTYQLFYPLSSDIHGSGICAVWYCESIEKAFILQIKAEDPLYEAKEFLKDFKPGFWKSG